MVETRRKHYVLHDVYWEDEENLYLDLTPEQVRLLEILEDNGLLDGVYAEFQYCDFIEEGYQPEFFEKV